jgi:hypothetical protein
VLISPGRTSTTFCLWHLLGRLPNEHESSGRTVSLMSSQYPHLLVSTKSFLSSYPLCLEAFHVDENRHCLCEIWYFVTLFVFFIYVAVFIATCLEINLTSTAAPSLCPRWNVFYSYWYCTLKY